MAQVTLKGNPVNTNGNLPAKGSAVGDYTFVKGDLSEISLKELKGKKVILNIFPSVDTGTCATSVRKFNEKAAELDDTVIVCVSKDLPFAHARFCGAEGIENVISTSDFRSPDFAHSIGVKIEDGPLAGLNARSIVVLDEEGKVLYTQLVDEIVDEPDYDSALEAAKS